MSAGGHVNAQLYLRCSAKNVISVSGIPANKEAVVFYPSRVIVYVSCCAHPFEPDLHQAHHRAVFVRSCDL